MNPSSAKLRRDAVGIWQAGLEAVKSERLVRDTVRTHDDQLEIGPERIELDAIHRIAVVGAGKAGAGMAEGLQAALGESLLREKHLTGWINVPADCARPLAAIHLHPARPAGLNEPTPTGVEGSREIMRLVSSLGPADLCIALISGGGSALLPLPLDEITLDDKLAITRHLSAAGANIEELNTVRKQLSQIKGGGLARACRAGRLVTLVISDILGDPLRLIASGPTVDTAASPAEALRVLERYGARAAGISERVFDALAATGSRRPEAPQCQVTNLVIGNNATAVAAAAREARRLGYAVESQSAEVSEGPAEDVGRRLADMAIAMRDGRGPTCLVSGGEPTVKLAPAAKRGLGGRNQQLVLAAAERLQADGAAGVLILSGGTDGEDGPTDAAGAFTDQGVIDQARRLHLEPGDYLKRNDAYHWFEPLGALFKTGPTDTNVCDVRVVLVDRRK